MVFCTLDRCHKWRGAGRCVRMLAETRVGGGLPRRSLKASAIFGDFDLVRLLSKTSSRGRLRCSWMY